MSYEKFQKVSTGTGESRPSAVFAVDWKQSLQLTGSNGYPSASSKCSHC